MSQSREDGYFKLLGRESIDIIKSGGYKISALEGWKMCFSRNNNVKECAVIARQDKKWGEIVVAAVIAKHERISQKDLLRMVL